MSEGFQKRTSFPTIDRRGIGGSWALKDVDRMQG